MTDDTTVMEARHSLHLFKPVELTTARLNLKVNYRLQMVCHCRLIIYHL